MELKNEEKLQIVRAKTLDLQKKVKEKVKEKRFSFCRHCSSHGRYCVVADGIGSPSPDERERLIALADSLHSLFLSLADFHEQKKGKGKGRSMKNHHKIEEMRKVVRERARLFPEEERECGGLIAEVIEFVGDDDDESLWEILFDEEKKSVNGIYRFLVGTARFGLEYLVVFAAIYASLEFGSRISSSGINGKQHKDEDMSETESDSRTFLLTTHHQYDAAAAHLSLDVLRGRG